MTDDRAHRLKRFAFRSRHMGTAENDMLFGTFAERHLETLSDAELDMYDALLAENDVDIYKWVTGKQPVPPELDNRVLDLLKSVKDSL